MASPLYYNIFEYYKGLITSGQMQSGEKMPTEEEISKKFCSSRITTRHALDMLANQGLIIKVQGKGTFVSEKKAFMQLNEMMGFSAEMLRIGKVPSTIVRDIQVIEASQKVAEKLGIVVGAKVYMIERIRCADAIKVAFERVALPFHMVAGIEKTDLTGSLYKVLADRFNITPGNATESLEAMQASQKIADILDVKAGSPVLAMERLSFDKLGKVYEYTESIYRGDKYKFCVSMKKN